MVRLRNQFIEMDPRSWDVSMDVVVNVGVGDGTMEERVALLGNVAAKQEQILQTAGPNNPIVTLPQYTNTLVKMLELAGIKDTQSYFTRLPADFQMPEQEQKPSPEEMLAEVQRQSILADIEKKSAELELEREKMIRVDDRERDRIELDGLLRKYDMELKYNTQIQSAEINAALNKDREVIRQEGALIQAVANQPPQPMM
jgi:hypothetical protein